VLIEVSCAAPFNQNAVHRGHRIAPNAPTLAPELAPKYSRNRPQNARGSHNTRGTSGTKWFKSLQSCTRVLPDESLAAQVAHTFPPNTCQIMCLWENLWAREMTRCDAERCLSAPAHQIEELQPVTQSASSILYRNFKPGVISTMICWHGDCFQRIPRRAHRRSLQHRELQHRHT
jgi:hypothetical protein